MTLAISTQFSIDSTRFASLPAERRGVPRDRVKLLVASAHTPEVQHVPFADIAHHLDAGDVLVANNSATIAGQYDAHHSERGPVVVHVGSVLPGGGVMVEVRCAPDASRAVLDAEAGDVIRVGGATLKLVEPWPKVGSPTGVGNRIWRARVDGSLPTQDARPIAYGYLARSLPLEDYQSVFSQVLGSAEMPSAARPFTRSVLQRLTDAGVVVACLTLHTGFSSQEVGEPPLPEWRSVPRDTADVVNRAVAEGRRVVTVGTTSTRALESAVGDDGVVRPVSGWTSHVIGPDNPARVTDGIITGWHDQGASHLALVESVAGKDVTQRAYASASASGYLWHEFGDAGLLLRR